MISQGSLGNLGVNLIHPPKLFAGLISADGMSRNGLPSSDYPLSTGSFSAGEEIGRALVQGLEQRAVHRTSVRHSSFFVSFGDAFF